MHPAKFYSDETGIPIDSLLANYATGAFSPYEFTQTLLREATALNDKLGAFLAFDTEGALSSARIATEKWTEWRKSHHPKSVHSQWQLLPQWGVPVSIKDTIEQAGLPTTYGSLVFAQHKTADSPIVTQLRDQGLVLFAKTATSEFALSMVTATRLSPPARNPYDLTRTAGGSSGGAAAATAAGLGTFGLGTDSVGSIRYPAALCGLFGLKPTFGRIKNRQQWRASPLRSHLGPLARTANDLAFAWKHLAVDDEPITPLAQTDNPDGFRIGVDGKHGDPAVNEFLELFKEHSSAVEHIDVSDILSPPNVYSQDGSWIFAADHVAAAERLAPHFMENHGNKLTHYAFDVYSTGASVPAWEYRRLTTEVEDFRESSQRVFKAYDLIVSPIETLPPVLEETTNPSTLGQKYPRLSLWNLTGNPALAIPLQPGPNGFPRAVQVIAPKDKDRLLIRIAMALNQISNEASCLG